MRLVNRKYGLEFQLSENAVLNIVCENRIAFESLIADFIGEINGGDGAWILSNNEEEISLSKSAEIILNPFSVTCNDRKILNAVYKELHTIADQIYPELFAEANSKILNFIDSIVIDVPYALEYNPSGDIEGVFKIYDVKFDEELPTLEERVISYIKTTSQVLRRKVFILVNIKSFLEDSAIQQLYKESMYSKVLLILLESKDYPKLDGEKKVLIDSDLCIIEA